jgi:hypothetical protein
VTGGRRAGPFFDNVEGGAGAIALPRPGGYVGRAPNSETAGRSAGPPRAAGSFVVGTDQLTTYTVPVPKPTTNRLFVYSS